MKLPIALMLFAAAAQGSVILDNFNRADANTLGANWTARFGGGQITGNTAEALGGGQNPNLETYNSYTTNSLSVDVADAGTSTAYIALVLGYQDINHNYFIKVQDNGSGQFTSLGVYFGNNGSTSNNLFQPLTTPFTTGNLTATLTGTMVTVNVTPTAGVTQVYTLDYGVATGGTGIGLGLYGTALADNFADLAAGTATPEPGTLGLFSLGLGAAFLLARRKRA